MRTLQLSGKNTSFFVQVLIVVFASLLISSITLTVELWLACWVELVGIPFPRDCSFTPRGVEFLGGILTLVL